MKTMSKVCMYCGIVSKDVEHVEHGLYRCIEKDECSQRMSKTLSDFESRIVEYMKVRQEIKENLVDDYLNFDDSSVGINSIGKLDKTIIDEISTFEDITVTSWEDHSMSIDVGKFSFRIDFVVSWVNGECVDACWEIVE